MEFRKTFYIANLIIIFLLFLVIFPLTSQGDDFIDITDKSGFQGFASSAWNSQNREYLVVWQDKKAKEIRGRFLDPNGNLKEVSFKISRTITFKEIEENEQKDYNIEPSIAYNSKKNNYLITWHDYADPNIYADPNNIKEEKWKIYASLVEGNKPKDIALPTLNKHSWKSKVASNKHGFLIVCYEYDKQNQNGPGFEGADIRGFQLDPNGTPKTTIMICNEEEEQIDPVVTGYTFQTPAEDIEGWMVSWVDKRNISYGGDIYGAFVLPENKGITMIYPENGTVLYSAEGNQADQVSMKIMSSPDNYTFYLFWKDTFLNTEGVETKCLLGSVGKNLSITPKFYVPLETSLASFGVTSLQNNTLLIVFKDQSDNDKKSKIYGQRFSYTGTPLDINTEMLEYGIYPKPFVLSDPNNENTDVSVAFAASDPEGNALITWQVLKENDDDSSDKVVDYDISGCIYTPPEPPLLKWVSKDGFKTDGVDPDSAEGGSEFTFKIDYKKSAKGGDTPISSYISIDLNNDGILDQDESFIMEVDPDEETIYQTTIPILFDDPNNGESIDVTFNFLFQDELNMAAGEPSKPNQVTIRKAGDAPRLLWPKETEFKEIGLKPYSMEVDTEKEFTFKVLYQDGDNDYPKVKKVWIDINRDSRFDNDEKFDCGKDSGSKYSEGVTYKCQKSIFANQLGLLAYQFYFDDGKNVAQGEPKQNNPKKKNYLTITNTSEKVVHSGRGIQAYPDVAVTSQGGLIVWQDLRDAEAKDKLRYPIRWEKTNIRKEEYSHLINGEYKFSKIYARLLDADGDSFSPQKEIRIGTNDKNQLFPKVAGEGEVFLVVWEDYNDIDGDEYELYWANSGNIEDINVFGQIIDLTDPDSSIDFPIAAYFKPNATEYKKKDNRQNDPAVAAGEKNKFLVVWTDNVSTSVSNANQYDIYGTIIEYDPQDHTATDIKRSDPNDNNDYKDSDRGYIIAGNDPDNDEDETYRGRATAAWGKECGKYLVAYQYSTDRYVNYAIRAKLVDPNGRVESSEELDCSGNDNVTERYNPAVASNGNNFFIVWEQIDENNDNRHIWGVNYDATTNKFDDPIEICTAEGDHRKPQIYWDKENENYLVAWYTVPFEKSNEEIGGGIKCKRIYEETLAIPKHESNGLEICSGRLDVYFPTISGYGGDVKVSWMMQTPAPLNPHPYEHDILSVPIKSFINWTEDETFSYGVDNPSGGVDNPSGGNGQDFSFEIDYFGKAKPSVHQVWIDINGNGKYEANEKYDLEPETSTDSDDYTPKDGKKYKITLPINLDDGYEGDGIITYRFYFKDQDGAAAIGSPNLFGQINIIAPRIYFAGQSIGAREFLDSGVFPQSGKVNTQFSFYVIYQHENDPNVSQIWMDLDNDDDNEYEIKEDLNFYSDPNMDTEDTKLYSYQYTGTEKGTYYFKFYFKAKSDGRAVGKPALRQQFTVFDPPTDDWTSYTTKDGLPNDYVLSLASYKDNLWAGTIKGLGCFDGEEWAVTRNEFIDANTRINTMAVYTKENLLYIGTPEGLFSYNGSDWEFFNEVETEGTLKDNEVFSLAIDQSNQRLWIHSLLNEESEVPKTAGLIQYNIAAPSNAWIKYTVENTYSHTGGGLKGNKIGPFITDDEGNLWIHTYSQEKDEAEDDDEPAPITPHGLLKFTPDKKEWKHFSAGDSDILQIDSFTKLHITENKTLWAGGLSPVSSIEEEDMAKGGLYRFDLQKEQWVKHINQVGDWLGSISITALYGNDAHLWVGTWPYEDEYEGGASFFDGSNWELYNFQNSGLECNYVNTIIIHDRATWFGTRQGLYRYKVTSEAEEKSMDPNNRFLFPTTNGCFADSFQQSINMINIFYLGLFFVLLGIAIGFFYIVRRYHG